MFKIFLKMPFTVREQLKIFNKFSRRFIKPLKLVFCEPLFSFLAISLAANLLLVYYLILLRVTTLAAFWQSNTVFYNIASIVLTILVSVAFGAAISLVIFQWRKRKQGKLGASGNSFFGAFFGAISVGCPVCGAFVASLFGIAGGLFAFPFQGLEIKTISLFLLGFSIFSSVRAINQKSRRICEAPKKKEFIKFGKGDFVWSFDKNVFKSLKSFVPLLAGIFVLILIMYLPVIAQKTGFKFSFQPNSQKNVLAGDSSSGSPLDNQKIDSSELLAQINPADGFATNAIYGNIGPKMLESGAIDLEKFKSIYERSGQSLTSEQLKILTEGSSEKIKINRENSYFLINFLWALGLVNKNPILDEGPMMQYGGKEKVGYFASTGGWTLGIKDSTELYSSAPIIVLSASQQEKLEDFAYNSYRPCCNNSTAFADCNHGMAALGLGEIMAANGASAEDMFEALKYFNGFWFPQQYLDLAKYFKAKEGKDWDKVDARIVMGKDYSTASGWSRVRKWLSDNNLIEKAPSSGGSCGA